MVNEERLAFAKLSIQLLPHIIIGSNCEIHDKSVIGECGFGFARDYDNTLVKINHGGGVRIGDNVTIRAFCTIDQATIDETYTQVMDGTKIDHHCHIAHNAIIGKNNTIAAGTIIEGSCVIGDNNTFGTNVVVQKKVKVGNNCIIGSSTIITKDVPDNSIIYGNPGRIKPDLNSLLHDFDDFNGI